MTTEQRKYDRYLAKSDAVCQARNWIMTLTFSESEGWDARSEDAEEALIAFDEATDEDDLTQALDICKGLVWAHGVPIGFQLLIDIRK